MNELKLRIHDDSNGLDYILVGDYYIPDLRLEEQEERRPIGKWGRMHRRYLEEYRHITYVELVFSGRMGTYLADINEQAQARLELLIDQMKAAEGVTEDLKRRDWWKWVQMMGNIQNRAEEIVLAEIIYN
ncbi:MAG: TnpV protein [Lachnospiraceae bacterium]|nr:TnpV protein [Lachnospiraceae bacterium]